MFKVNNLVFDLIIFVSIYIGKCFFILKFSLSNLSRIVIIRLMKKKEFKVRILLYNFIIELFVIIRWCIFNSIDLGIWGSRFYFLICR